MLKATIELRWSDGSRAAAALLAESAEADYPVQYSGAVARLVDAPAESGFAFLAFVMRRIATNTGAKYSERISGTYDRWTGGRGRL